MFADDIWMFQTGTEDIWKNVIYIHFNDIFFPSFSQNFKLVLSVLIICLQLQPILLFFNLCTSMFTEYLLSRVVSQNGYCKVSLVHSKFSGTTVNHVMLLLYSRVQYCKSALLRVNYVHCSHISFDVDKGRKWPVIYFQMPNSLNIWLSPNSINHDLQREVKSAMCHLCVYECVCSQQAAFTEVF